MIGNNNTSFSKNLQQDNSETVTNGHDKETPKDILKDIDVQKKDRKLLIIWDLYNSIIMEYQKVISLLDNTQNQPTAFRTKDFVGIMMDHIERTILIVKLHSKFQWWR